MASGVKKMPIGGLSPDVNNALIVAVIISKQDLKSFISKKENYLLDAEERGVWSLTLRDSPVDTINGSIWGSIDFIKYTYDMFNVGDVVEIISPRVLFKEPGSSSAIFSPAVSSPFQLHIQENSSSILLHSEDMENIKSLIHIPTKSPGDYIRLSDVCSYGQAMKGEYVNLLVAIKSLDQTKNVKSKKESKNLVCRRITVMDQSQLEFHITLWSPELIQRSDSWRSRQTIIFFADVRLEWDNFRSETTVIITSKTIITENPKTKEALLLQNFAKTAPIHPTEILDHLANNFLQDNYVKIVMTTAQILDKAFSGKNSSEQFCALVYATITQLNIDGTENVTMYNCSSCSQTLDDTGHCFNKDCLTTFRPDVTRAQISFNLLVNLTDHRGTLYNCRLVSPAADQILGCSVKSYTQMTIQEKTRLKWKLLLTKCEARVLVISTSPERPRPLISLLSCLPANPKEVSSKLPVY